MQKYIPSNLDIDILLSDVPPIFKYNRDCFVYILGLLTEIPANKKDLLNGTTFISVNAQILKSHVHQYKQYIDYLLQNGIIETDNRYVKDEKSKGYRFTPMYETPIRPVAISKYTLIKGLNKTTNWERDHLMKYRALRNWFDELEFDHAGAEQWLRKQYESDLKVGVEGATTKFNANLMNIFRLREKDYYFRVDKSAGRAHSNLTSLKSDLRGWLSWQRKPLVSNDLQCAQPLLTTMLLKESFYDKTSAGGSFTLHQLDPKLHKTINIEEVKELIRNGSEEIARYLAAVQGDIYLYMQKELSQRGFAVSTRNDAKNIMYSVLYSHNNFFAQAEALPKREFCRLFPTVYQIFCYFKRKESNALAVLMQRAEATLVLDRVAKRISKEQPKVALYTIHDALLSPDGMQDYVKRVMEEETIKAIGISPKIKLEVLLPIPPSTEPDISLPEGS